MLLGVLAPGQHGLASLVYYVITYALTTLGAFGVVAIIQQQTGSDRLSDFAGLSRRAPVLSLCMMVFMLSQGQTTPSAYPSSAKWLSCSSRCPSWHWVVLRIGCLES